MYQQMETCKGTYRRAYTRKNGTRVKSACVGTPCPPGKIRRVSYVRRLTSKVRREGYLKHTSSGRTIKIHPKKQTITVPASCIKNVGKPGRGPASSGLGRQGPQLIGPLRKGQLRKFGYSYKDVEPVRHAALARAIAADGRTTVFHRLNAVAKLTVSGAPSASAVFAADRNWVLNAPTK